MGVTVWGGGLKKGHPVTQRKDTGATPPNLGTPPGARSNGELAADSAEGEKDQEIGSIVHDFKNVLSAIRGFASVIGEDLPAGDQTRDDVEQILIAVDRGAQLAQRLLAWRGRAPRSLAGVPIELPLERSIGRTLPQPQRSATVLVVEDDDLVRTMTVRVLRRDGYAAVEAGDAAAAAARAADPALEIDLLLVDIGLPTANGIELVELLRGRWPAAQVLYMSAFGRTVLAEQGIRPGPGFLEKPFAPITLLERIEIMLTPLRP
jgi:CheY-like chemotaxis protein